MLFLRNYIYLPIFTRSIILRIGIGQYRALRRRSTLHLDTISWIICDTWDSVPDLQTQILFPYLLSISSANIFKHAYQESICFY